MISELYDFSPLYPLKRKIVGKSPAGRVAFVVTVMRHGLYLPIMSELCSRITSRDFDRCFEMGDSDEVVHGIVKESLNDPALENAFISADENWWKFLVARYQRMEEEAPVPLELF